MRRASSVALGSFTSRQQRAPYNVDLASHRMPGGTVTVRPVRCKTGIAAARKVMLAHAVEDVASVVIDGKVTYGATWLCSRWMSSVDAVLLPADTDAPMCRHCANRLADDGPGVYRIFDQTGTLIYVGSSAFAHLRVAYHRDHAKWKDRIADAAVTRFGSIAEATLAELIAIKAEGPELNRLCAPAGAA